MLTSIVQAVLAQSFSQPILSVVIDSRKVCRGSLFFALSGEKTDGHLYLEEVSGKGAVAAVIRSDYRGVVPNGFPVIRVESPLIALQDLARARVREIGARVVAITGSVGKTTTKEFTRQIFEVEKRVSGTSGNHNSQIGMSMSLLNNLRGDEEWIIVEMGMSQEGQIRTLVDIVPPDISVITAVAPVHAVYFNSVEEIARAKAEIFERSETKINLFNADIAYGDVLRGVGLGEKKAFSARGHRDAFWTIEKRAGGVTVVEGEESHELPCLSLPAEHLYENLIAAIAAARSAGVSWGAIGAALPHLSLPKGRLEISCSKGVTFINDAYNASEMSMLSALDVLSGYAPSRRVAVLGQMMELGTHSEGCHRRVGKKASSAADLLFCVGEACGPLVNEWQEAKGTCVFASSLDELMIHLQKELREGDVVLLKGSHSNKLWKVVEFLAPFKIG